MSRDPFPEPGEPEPPAPARSGRVGATDPRVLVVLAVTGLVLGWLVRPVTLRLDLGAPQVGWLRSGALAMMALILGAVARVTQRDLHRRGLRLQPHHAVNRLVLAKACALAGALVAGGYAGHALSWLGVAAEPALDRLVRSAVAAAAATLVLVTALLLERACRVGDDRSEP